MEGRRNLSVLGRKVRAMRKPLPTANNYRNPTLQPGKDPQISIGTSDLGISPKDSDEIVHLETQKHILTNKLAQLSQDFAKEEQKRRRLEEDVIRARAKASGAFEKTQESEELHDRLQDMQAKLDSVQEKYHGNLERLAEMRSHLDKLRRDRYEVKKVDDRPEDCDRFVKKSDEKREVAKLTESERAELVACQKEMEKLSRTKRSQSSMSATAPLNKAEQEIEEIVQKTDQYQMMIRNILDVLKLNDLTELFAEAEMLERENVELYNYIAENDDLRRSLQDDIVALERQFKELMVEKEASEEEQKTELDKLNAEINDVRTQLTEIETRKNKDELEFSAVYSEIEQLFNALECSWDDSPDETTTVSTQNAMFALSAIEATVAELMSDIAKVPKTENQP